MLRSRLSFSVVTLLGLWVLVPRCGIAQVRIWHTEEDPERRARVIALADGLAQSLKAIREDFAESRGKLEAETTGRTYPAAAVAALLDRTESALRANLESRDLAALRVYVATIFSNARQELEISGPKQASLRTPARVALAAFRPDAAAAVGRKKTESVLDCIGKLLGELWDRANRKDLFVRLRVQGAPEADATFTMHPPGFSEESYTRQTDVELVDVVRGMYVYSLTKEGYKPIDCQSSGPDLPSCALNLWRDSALILDCHLEKGKKGICRQRDAKDPGCLEHDR